MSLFFFAPFPVSLESAAVVSSSRPVQFPFHVFVLGEFSSQQFILADFPFLHETVKNVVIETDSYTLVVQVFLGIITDIGFQLLLRHAEVQAEQNGIQNRKPFGRTIAISVLCIHMMRLQDADLLIIAQRIDVDISQPCEFADRK